MSTLHIDIHCPYCGSGQVEAFSDLFCYCIECGNGGDIKNQK